MSTVPPDVVKNLAPTGKLRAAINLGNPVLAQKDPAGGEPKGCAPFDTTAPERTTVASIASTDECEVANGPRE